MTIKVKKVFRFIFIVSMLIGALTINVFASSSNVGVTYRGHIQSIGWQNWVNDGADAGTTGRALRLEALNLKLTNAPGASIKYRTHVQSIGWQDWVRDGALAGTTGRALRVEAIEISLENLPGYTVMYRTHIQSLGWQPWVADGTISGTVGHALRAEAVEIKIIPKPTAVSLNKTTDELMVGETDNLLATLEPTNAINNGIEWRSSDNSIVNVDASGKVTAIKAGTAIITGTTLDGNKSASCSITVKPVKVTSLSLNKTTDELLVGKSDNLIGIVEPTNATNKAINWKSSDNSIATVDASGKITAIKAGTATITGTTLDGGNIASCTVNVENPIISDVSVSYQAHVQSIGWQDSVSDGAIAGTVGQALRMEGLKINLINAPMEARIKYQAHVQSIGWQDWVSEGDLAGTTGQGLRIEALKISLENLPGYTVMYRALVQNVGWQQWVMDGNIAGTEGRSLRIEAIEIKIVKTVDIEYYINVQGIGWQAPVSNGTITGTNGQPLKIEALNIKLINAPEGASIKYQTHVQSIGWQEWVTEGQDAGTIGQDLGIEALKIETINAPGYSVQYQVEVEKLGWQPWVCDGQEAGTDGMGLRIKGLRIRFVAKSDETDLPIIQPTNPNLNSISYNLASYLNSNSNIQSVEAAAVTLHDGITSNNCVYFSSEAMRRIGVYVPISMANTAHYAPYLSSIGLARQFNIDLLSLGDIAFTVNGSTGYPTHTFVFMDWVNPDDHSLAYVADNQGSTIHIRSMVQTDIYDAFSFFYHN